MDEPLSRNEVIDLPNTLLLDPETGMAAAYSGNHRLLAGAASARLIEYAKVKGYREVPWDESLYRPGGDWYAMPAWATAEVRGRCVLIWVRSGLESDAELREIPKH